jgi:hypothetical protein
MNAPRTADEGHEVTERAYGDDAFALADAHGLVLDGEVSP